MGQGWERPWDGAGNVPVMKQGWDGAGTGLRCPCDQVGPRQGWNIPGMKQGWDGAGNVPVAEQGWDGHGFPLLDNPARPPSRTKAPALGSPGTSFPSTFERKNKTSSFLKTCPGHSPSSEATESDGYKWVMSFCPREKNHQIVRLCWERG